jgi:hypothetical protein
VVLSSGSRTTTNNGYDQQWFSAAVLEPLLIMDMISSGSSAVVQKPQAIDDLFYSSASKQSTYHSDRFSRTTKWLFMEHIKERHVYNGAFTWYHFLLLTLLNRIFRFDSQHASCFSKSLLLVVIYLIDFSFSSCFLICTGVAAAGTG